MEASHFGDAEANKFVEFDYKKEKVRGILKKRARQYKCKLTQNDDTLSRLQRQRGGP
jgi:hypothetical protein